MKIEIRLVDKIDTWAVIRRSNVAGHPEGQQRLESFLARSVLAWVGLIDNEVACVWGLIPGSILGDCAYLWLLTTDLSDRHPFVFVRHSQLAVRKMLKTYPLIQGHVLADSPKSIRWLKWLGVEFGARAKGVIAFELRAKNG